MFQCSEGAIRLEGVRGQVSLRELCKCTLKYMDFNAYTLRGLSCTGTNFRVMLKRAKGQKFWKKECTAVFKFLLLLISGKQFQPVNH